MKRIIILVVSLISLFTTQAQTVVQDSTSQFQLPLSTGSFVFDKETARIWQITQKATPTGTLATTTKREVTSKYALVDSVLQLRNDISDSIGTVTMQQVFDASDVSAYPSIPLIYKDWAYQDSWTAALNVNTYQGGLGIYQTGRDNSIDNVGSGVEDSLNIDIARSKGLKVNSFINVLSNYGATSNWTETQMNLDDAFLVQIKSEKDVDGVQDGKFYKSFLNIKKQRIDLETKVFFDETWNTSQWNEFSMKESGFIINTGTDDDINELYPETQIQMSEDLITIGAYSDDDINEIYLSNEIQIQTDSIKIVSSLSNAMKYDSNYFITQDNDIPHKYYVDSVVTANIYEGSDVLSEFHTAYINGTTDYHSLDIDGTNGVYFWSSTDNDNGYGTQLSFKGVTDPQWVVYSSPSESGLVFDPTNSVMLYYTPTAGTISSLELNSTYVQVSKKLVAPEFQLSDLNIAPSSSTDTGIKGEIRITATYIYVCVDTDTWVRTELTTW